MNLLTCRCPTHEHTSDACEHGIGGWSSSGRAWRFALPEEPWGRFTLNYLEFLAAVIGPWIDHIEGNLPTLSCALSGTDSTTAEGWLRKSNFVSHGEKDADVAVKLATARKLADMLIETNTMLCSQWFQGKRNPEADSLSRDTDLSDADLTKLLLSSPECQLPSNFRIAPLPNEITSWIVSQARTLPIRKQLQRPQPRSTLSRGAAGLTEFLQLIGTGDDVFLDKVSPRDRTVILGAFAHAVRQASFSGPKFSRLAASTVRDAVSHVHARPSFRHNQRRDPGKDDIGQPSFLLQRQFRGHSQSDPAEWPEKAITCRLLREIASVRETEEDRAVGQLAVGAFFFAMRSCEHSRVSGERRTKLLRLRNIQFCRGRRRMHHNDHRSLLSADSVSVTFEFQKNDERDVTTTQHCTHDATLCPVRAWAALVKRVLGHPSTNSDAPVNAFVVNGVLKHIPAPPE